MAVVVTVPRPVAIFSDPATSFARTREDMGHSGLECHYARTRCEL
jgi:hypothetical protein